MILYHEKSHFRGRKQWDPQDSQTKSLSTQILATAIQQKLNVANATDQKSVCSSYNVVTGVMVALSAVNTVLQSAEKV